MSRSTSSATRCRSGSTSPVGTSSGTVQHKVDLVRADFAAGSGPVVFRLWRRPAARFLAGPTICFEVVTTGSVTWDERLERLFGLEPGGFDGTFDTYVSLLHPEDRDEVLSAVRSAVDSKSSYQVDHRVVWPDGSVHWLQGRGSVTLDDAGEVTGTIGCSGDITATKAAEVLAQRLAAEAGAVAERELRQRERLEFLAALTDSSLGTTDHREFMRSVTAAAVPRLGDWCSLHFVPDPGAAVVELEVADSDPAKVEWAKALSERYPYDPTGQTGVPAVIRTGNVEYIPDVDQAVIDEALASSSIDRGEAQAILDALSSDQRHHCSPRDQARRHRRDAVRER